MMQVAILAGGLGTRLRPLTDRVPKPMVLIHGKPFLEYQLEWIRRFGFDRILLLVGYLAESIERYFQDGSRWGLTIQYSREPSPMGTAGALKLASNLLEDQFLLLNGDTFLPINYTDMVERFMECQMTGLMAVYTNEEGVAPNNIAISEKGLVMRYDKVVSVCLTHVDAGAYVFRKSVLDWISPGKVASLEGNIFSEFVSAGGLMAYPVHNRYYDIGTFERLAAAEKVLQ